MICINCTLYEFLRENMWTGISNMEDIHEMMLWNLICMFRVPMTTVLIQITSFFKSGKSFKVDAFWQKLAHNYMKIYSQFRWCKYTSASEFRFWIEGQNLADRLILSAKLKIFEKSASKNKHPIKLRFSNWRLQSDNPEKKVIPG